MPGPPARRPVGDEDRSDEVAARDGAPGPGVTRVRPVVAQEEVVIGGDPRPRSTLVVAQLRVDVRLLELLAVDEDGAVALGDLLAGEPDQALDEGAATVAGSARSGPRRPLEDDHLSSLRT